MIREFGFIDLLYLLGAARWTVALSAVAFIGGGLVGLLVALMRVAPFAPVRWLAMLYVQAIQGTPLLAWLFLFYFGLPLVGLVVNPWIAAATAFAIYAGAFFGEIWRGAVAAIPRTQWEAGSSLGLGFLDQLRYIIVPQAIPPRSGSWSSSSRTPRSRPRSASSS